MRIFLAGGTGVIGSRLLPALVAAGHEVVATTRREDRLALLEGLGARGLLLDVYDAERVAAALAEVTPDLVLHQLTDLRRGDRDANARLRREGTANLVAGAEAAGVDRIVVQSITWLFPDGDAPATEDDPIVPGTPVDVMEGLVRLLPHATVLRYGTLYGPGTWYAPGGRVAAAVTAGQLPATPAITSFVHVDDVVAATVQSLGWPDGTYHVVDDEPAPATEWLPVYAAGIGAPTPPTAPLPEDAPVGRAVSNAKARAAGWTPAHPSWSTGFAATSQPRATSAVRPSVKRRKQVPDMSSPDLETRIKVIDEHDFSELPSAGHLMTVVVEIPPNNPGTPPHRHSGPVYGYMVEGRMIFELEGDAPVVLRPGDPIWEPGGDRIHYQAANPGDTWARFVVVMVCKPGEPMLTFVEPEELAARKHLRHPGPVVDPQAKP